MKDKELTPSEKKIIQQLRKLEKIWKEHGAGLVLFNGNELRRGHSSSDTIATFSITGDGGDGGDYF